MVCLLSLVEFVWEGFSILSQDFEISCTCIISKFSVHHHDLRDPVGPYEGEGRKIRGHGRIYPPMAGEFPPIQDRLLRKHPRESF